jgi:ribonuclease J
LKEILGQELKIVYNCLRMTKGMKDGLRIMSLGGYGEVTRNMFVYETGEEILLVDCGIGFPTEEMLGVDLLLPDSSYLRGKEEKIVGMVLTHGHEDHVGALPYLLPKLPKGMPIYASRLTKALAEDKLAEFGITGRVREADLGESLRLGSYEIKFVHVTHSIPDATNLVINTPVGIIYHGSDFKFDLTPVDGKQTEFGKIAAAGEKGVVLLLSDCLRSERQGSTPSEQTLYQMFEREIRGCKGKFIVTTMSSNISRLQQAIEVSLRRGRKIVPVGRSIERNLAVAARLGYVSLKPNQVVSYKDLRRREDKQLTFLIAGSQGQEGSAMQRVSMGEHDFVKIRPGDKVVFSTDYIPGTEAASRAVIDALYREGAEVVYSELADDLHVSGHGAQQDLMLMVALTKPRFMLPIGGNYRQMKQYTKLAERMGYGEDKVIIPEENGSIVVGADGKVRQGNPVEVRNVFVDGLGVGDVGKVVLRDRQLLAEEGVVVAVVQIDRSAKQVVGEPDLISRGFVFAKKDDVVLPEATQGLKELLNSKGEKLGDARVVRQYIDFYLREFFFKKLRRRPMILPVVVEV